LTGNLSSERVTKREVFDLFHRFGRLAQISLKSAYGFVQYHTAEEAEAAMQAAQGVEMGGRTIRKLDSCL
jgi:nuclear polyadenylated RNA-binding protein 3